MPKTILIVDDDPEVINVIKLHLKAAGYDVITAPDGQQGVARAKEALPDLILVDFMMPNMDGAGLVRSLKMNKRTCQIPIIFLSAIFWKKEEEAGQKIQIDDKFYPAISKPFEPEKVIAKIMETLQ